MSGTEGGLDGSGDTGRAREKNGLAAESISSVEMVCAKVPMVGAGGIFSFAHSQSDITDAACARTSSPFPRLIDSVGETLSELFRLSTERVCESFSPPE